MINKLFIIYGKEDLTKTQIKELKKLGYVLTTSKENLYHPTHWTSINAGIFNDEGECIDCGHFYSYEDAFNAKTPEALNWAIEED